MKKLIFASDSFKGSLTSKQTARLLEQAAKKVYGECKCLHVPIADGGEGTVEAVVEARGGCLVRCEVHGPLMEPVTAFYGRIGEKEAVIEMAQASGLPLVPEDKRNPLHTTTYGTGELMLHALQAGATEIAIAIGGSATNDGGMGFARALGVRFLDENGQELEGFGRDLEHVSQIDTTGITPLLQHARITVMCDVTNPLTGPDGATRTFGEQKGGTPEILDRLETGMENYRRVLMGQFGRDPNETPGIGAAGGLGAALLFFAHGRMQSGIETVLQLIDFDKLITGADMVITGEGRTDWQSAFGKVLKGVGDHAKAKGVPAYALCGSLGEGYERIYEHGIRSLMTTVNGPMALSEALTRAEELYYKAAVRMFRMIG